MFNKNRKTLNARIVLVFALVVGVFGVTPSQVNADAVDGSISGIVYKSDGVTPIADIFVSISGNGYYDDSCTNASGEFAFSGLSFGVQFKIEASPPWANCGAWSNYVQEFWQESRSSSNASLVTLDAQNPNRTDIDFTLDAGGVISGTVYAADGVTPLQHIAVSFHDDYGTYGNSVCTDANGQYEFHGLPFDMPLRVRTYSYHDSWCNASADYVSEYWQEAVNRNSSSLVMVTAGSPELTNINFTLDTGGVISGTVYAADGITPLEHIAVSFQGEYVNDYSESVCTDATGHYEFHAVPFDMPLLVSTYAYHDNWCNAGGNYISEYWQESPDIIGATLVTVTSLSPLQDNIDFTLDSAGSISGTVYEADGVTPIPDIPVKIFGNNYWGESPSTDSLGHYTIHNVPFGLSIYLYAGDASLCVGANSYAVEFWSEAPSLDTASLVSVSAQTPDLTGADFTLDSVPCDSSGPSMRVWYVDDGVEADNWPVGTHLTLEIEDMTTPASPDYSTGMEVNELIEWFNLKGQFDIKPGMFVVLSGASMSRVVKVNNLTITNIDQDLDTITGTTSPDYWLWMWINDPACCRSGESDGSGIWVFDYSVPGTGGELPIDIRPGSEGAVHVPSGDGSTSVEWFIPYTKTFKSTDTQDGWILESSEISNKGGTLNATITTFNLGDDATRKQYRGILSFNTSSLPDNATITKVTLKVKQQAIVGGGNPVTSFQGFMVDIRKGVFGTTALQASDFQTIANKTYGPFNTALTSGWYSLNLTAGKAYINKLSTLSGLTQIRLHFKLDDNNNTVANYLSLYSGNAGAANRPQLIVEYRLP